MTNQNKKQKGVLSGLTFLVLHNRVNYPAVKAKMGQWERNGAKVVTEMSDEVTHIMVPKTTRQKVKKTLDLEEIPDTVEVVTDEWAAKCISGGEVVDTEPYHVAEGEETHKEEPNQEYKEEKQLDDKLNARDNGGDDLDHAIELNKIEAQALELLENETDEEEPKLKGDWSGYLAKQKSDKTNPNHRTITLFTLLMQYYESIGDTYRKMAYRRGVSTLEKTDHPVRTYEQAKKLSGIGDSLARKIQEITETGTLKKAEAAEQDPMAKAMAEFKKIHGVGSVTARKWYDEGMRTLKDIEQRTDLNESQRIGLDHIDDFNALIPRDVVEKHAKVVRDELSKADCTTYLMGSYRRGSKWCGDVDIILTKKDAEIDELLEIQNNLVESLKESGFIQCQLSGHNPQTKRWMGASKLEDETAWRRLDILVVPWTELGASLIYYTGNDLFNRSIRLLAVRKQMRLSQHGLYKEPYGHRDPNREPSQDDLIESRDEQKIFEHLGVPYRKPEERSVG